MAAMMRQPATAEAFRLSSVRVRSSSLICHWCSLRNRLHMLST
jgi:hypothetical protein